MSLGPSFKGLTVSKYFCLLMRNRLIQALIIKLSIFSFLGCVHARIPAANPAEAQIPELEFSYVDADGRWHSAYGHATDIYARGCEKRFRVNTPEAAIGSECFIRVINGDLDFLRKKPKGASFVELDLGEYTALEPSQIGFSLFCPDQDYKTQGFFYPTVDDALLMSSRPLPVTFQCPYFSVNKFGAVCTRPAGYPFVVVAAPEEGSELFSTIECAKSTFDEEVANQLIPSSGPFEVLEYLITEPQYCQIAIVSKKKNPENKDNPKIFLRFIHVQFYNPNYSPVKEVAPEIETPAGFTHAMN